MNPVQESGNYDGLKSGQFLRLKVCTEYRNVYDTFASQPDKFRSSYYNWAVRNLIGTGLWDILDLVRLYGCHINTGGEAALNWKSPLLYAGTFFNSPIHTPDQGVLFNGTTQYFNHNWIPSVSGVNYTQNSASHILYIRTDINGNNGHGVSSNCFIMPKLTNVAYMRMNTGSSTNAANTNASGLFINTRTAVNISKLYRNGNAIINSATNSIGVPTCSPYTGAWNNNPAAGGFRADQVFFEAWGAGLSQAQVTTLTYIVNTLATLLGVNIF